MKKAAATTLESELRALSVKLLNFFAPLATEIYKKVCPEDALAREPYIARAHLLSLLLLYCPFKSLSLRIHLEAAVLANTGAQPGHADNPDFFLNIGANIVPIKKPNILSCIYLSFRTRIPSFLLS